MDIRQLKYFMAVVEEGTVSAAARKLHISQPPLSRQMHLLEEEYGVPLFERGSRHIRVTQAGSTLYRYASEIVELTGAAADELSGLRAGKFGTIRIGTVSSSRSRLLRRALGEFRAERPEFRFRVTEGNTYEILEKIRKFEIELAFIRTPFPAEGLEMTVIQEDPMAVCGPASVLRPGRGGINHEVTFTSKEHGIGSENDWNSSNNRSSQIDDGSSSGEMALPKTEPETAQNNREREASLDLRELEGVPLIIYRRWESILRDRFAAAGISPKVVCICEDARTALSWAEAGMGAAVVPASAAAPAFGKDHGWVIRPLADDHLRTRLTCVRMRDAAHTSQADRLFQLVKEEVRRSSR